VKVSLNLLIARTENTRISFIIGFIAFCLIFSSLSNIPFCTRGEPREALNAVSIINHGTFLIPFGYNNEIASKPPFFHWLIALFSLPYNEVTEFTSRLPSAVFSIIFIVLFFQNLAPLLGKSKSILACFILFINIEWFRSSVSARVDMVHSVSLALAIIYWFKWFHDENRNDKLKIIMTLFVLLATMSKGPVALVIISLVVIFELLWQKKYQLHNFLNNLIWVNLIPASVALIWYLCAFTFGGSEFTNLFIDENLSRFMGTMKDPAHYHGFWYLILVLIIGLIPWSWWLIPLGLISYGNKGRLSLKGLNPIVGFSFRVAITIIGFYSLSSGKRSVYLLAAYPFISILFAIIIHPEVYLKRYPYIRTYPARLTILIYILLSLVFLGGSEYLTSYFPEKSFRYIFIVHHIFLSLNSLEWIFFLMPLVVSMISFKSKIKVGYSESVVTFSLYITTIIALQIVLLSHIARLMSQKGIAQEFTRTVKSDTPVYSYKTAFYGFSFYANYPITDKNPPFFKGDVVILKQKHLDDIVKTFEANLDYKLILLEPTALKEGDETVVIEITNRSTK
jgi:4-amino-4-deoxy-L-arabinose transferase-like glycosyltransferase